jgi:hypothetical protein
MAGPDELDLDLDKLAEAVSKAKGEEMETLRELLEETENDK